MAHLWVLGDSWTDPTSFPWSAAQGWPTLLATRLGFGLVNTGVGATGYAATAALPHFPAQAARGAGVGAAAVIVWGSLNDPQQWHTPAEITAGATTTYGLIRRLCPAAPLLVAGPQWGDQPAPPELYAARDAVRTAAAAAGATFLDPLDWFTGQPELILPDHLHPTPPGHALIADRLTPELLWALAPDPPSLPHVDEGGWISPYLADAAATLPSPPIGSEP